MLKRSGQRRREFDFRLLYCNHNLHAQLIFVPTFDNWLTDPPLYENSDNLTREMISEFRLRGH